MEVLDIVRSSAVKCGVVSSFSLDDMPGDVIDNGVRLLATEILPALNCDRTLDITTTARVYKPVNGLIVLKPFKPQPNFDLIGYSQYTAAELLDVSNNKWRDEVFRLRPQWGSYPYWPVDDFGAPITAGMWSSDMHLIGGESITTNREYDANIDFPPMRIDYVLDAATRLELTVAYRHEFEQALPNGIGVYTTEEYEDHIKILVKGPLTPKIIIMPVPLQIVNISQTHAGTIHAPEKFRKYLVDATAVQLAGMYGVSSLDRMQAEAAQSLNLLKKNLPQPLHETNVAQRIGEYLGRRPFYLNDRGIFGR